MKGAYDEQLWRLLNQAYLVEKRFTQDAFAAATGKEQTGAGGYLNRTKGSTLDLDEAHGALSELLGSSLREFVNGAPIPAPSPIQVLAAQLLVRPDLAPVLEGLLDVPLTRLDDVLGLITGVVQAARKKRVSGTPGSGDGTPQKSRTTRKSTRRR